MSATYAYEDIAKMIDHSILKPTATDAQLEAGIDLAIAYDVASVCLVPYYVKRCAERLAGTTVTVSTTIGFPHGGHASAIKLAEAKQALDDGCQELDLVCNISKVLSGDWDYVRDDLQPVIDAAHDAGQKVKIIFENCYLEDEHKIRLCEICTDLGADWAKTSTGYGTGGATDDDLKLMVAHVGPGVQVKAAGGVRDLPRTLAVREIGVTRIGASATKAILDAAREELGLSPIPVEDTGSSGGY